MQKRLFDETLVSSAKNYFTQNDIDFGVDWFDEISVKVPNCLFKIPLLLIWFHVIFILIAKNVLVSDPSLKWFACFVSISEQLTMFRSSLVRNSKGVCFNSETTIEEKVQEIDEDTWPFIFAAKSECTTYNMVSMVSKLILEQSPIFRLKNWQKRPRKIWQI